MQGSWCKEKICITLEIGRHGKFIICVCRWPGFGDGFQRETLEACVSLRVCLKEYNCKLMRTKVSQ